MSLITLKLKKIRKSFTNTLLFDSERLLASINRLFFHFLKSRSSNPHCFFNKNIMMFGRSPQQICILLCSGDRLICKQVRDTAVILLHQPRYFHPPHAQDKLGVFSLVILHSLPY